MDWRAILRESLTSAGYQPADAQGFAELCIAGLEGALMLARVARSPGPIDCVEQQLQTLLTHPPT